MMHMIEIVSEFLLDPWIVLGRLRGREVCLGLWERLGGLSAAQCVSGVVESNYG